MKSTSIVASLAVGLSLTSTALSAPQPMNIVAVPEYEEEFGSSDIYFFPSSVIHEPGKNVVRVYGAGAIWPPMVKDDAALLESTDNGTTWTLKFLSGIQRQKQKTTGVLVCPRGTWCEGSVFVVETTTYYIQHGEINMEDGVTVTPSSVKTIPRLASKDKFYGGFALLPYATNQILVNRTTDDKVTSVDLDGNVAVWAGCDNTSSYTGHTLFGAMPSGGFWYMVTTTTGSTTSLMRQPFNDIT